jgi:hypothetical protein
VSTATQNNIKMLRNFMAAISYNKQRSSHDDDDDKMMMRRRRKKGRIWKHYYENLFTTFC